jgi:hypothetical protein
MERVLHVQFHWLHFLRCIPSRLQPPPEFVETRKKALLTMRHRQRGTGRGSEASLWRLLQRHTLAQADPHQINRTEPNQIESNRIESNQIESNRIESNRIEIDKMGCCLSPKDVSYLHLHGRNKVENNGCSVARRRFTSYSTYVQVM